jgi:hypothetical protein
MSSLGTSEKAGGRKTPDRRPIPANENIEQASDGTTVTIDENGNVYFDAPSPAIRRNTDDNKFEANLAESLDDRVLDGLASDTLDGIDADILSRSEFIQNYNKGIDLLGLKLEEASASRGTRTSISRSKNASLLQACMQSQSNARSQMLPAMGPAKVQTISGETASEDDLARMFGNDLNYFLTDVDKGFYPDTDRMLFYRAFGGSTYKKVYRDPILRRPTSRFLPLTDLIVSENASSLEDALRKTHEMLYSPVQVRVMQARGGWIDTELGQAQMNISPARTKVMQSQGLSANTTRSQDISHTIYESYIKFEAEDYGFDDRKSELGMPAPYRLVMDRDSRKILALHRNWKPKDKMFLERPTFVKFGLVPGLGFLDYGFLHLIGNQVRVLTALTQILVDKGMIANFPGGLKVKGIRTATNELNPGLGEWVEVDIGSMKSIKDALMQMPYSDPGQGAMALMEMLQKNIDKVSGVLEIPTATGNANTPVGTILAVIEQQAQNLTAVQQRDHRAQREELRLIRDLFAEHPEDLKCLQRKRKDAVDWAQKVQEFMDLDLVPVSDPNIPSQSHRILLNQFLMSMAEKAPDLFKKRMPALAERILRGVGINDGKDFLPTPPEWAQAMAQSEQQQGGKPSPASAAAAKAQAEAPIKQAELGIEQQRLQIEQEQNQREAASQAQDGQLRAQKQEAELANAQRELDQEDQRLQTEAAQAGADAAPDPQSAADLEKTKAGAFQAVASGIQSLAAANETAKTGAQQAQAIEDGATPSGVTPEPPPQTLSAQPNASKKAPKAKPKGKT